METKATDNYFKIKKPAAIATMISVGVVLLGLIAAVVLDTIKIRDIEARINTVGELTQMGPGGNMRGNFKQGGEMPEMNGEMPEMNGEEAPELPAEMMEDSTKSDSSTKNKSTKKSASETTN